MSFTAIWNLHLWLFKKSISYYGIIAYNKEINFTKISPALKEEFESQV